MPPTTPASRYVTATLTVVAGRERSWPAGSLIAAANTTSAVAMPRSTPADALALAVSRRAMATFHWRTMLRIAARCMLTPMVVEASPRASRDTATSTSCTEETPPPPNSTGIGATRNRPRRSASRCSVANVAFAVVVDGGSRELIGEALGIVDQPRAGFRRGLQLRAGGEWGRPADHGLVERVRSGCTASRLGGCCWRRGRHGHGRSVDEVADEPLASRVSAPRA